MTGFSQKENERYDRHFMLKGIGVEGQKLLKNARVIIIGAGGLGCPVLQYLTAAGIGSIGIVDDDVVELSNLQRQVLFNESMIGTNKAVAAKETLEKLNREINIIAYPNRLDNKNALEYFRQYDIVVDCTDNFSTRYLINDASVITDKPFVYGGIHQFEGQVSVFNYKQGPTYRCLFPVPPDSAMSMNCSEIGVIGTIPGIIGMFQANETIKIILGIGEVLNGLLLIYNTLSHSIQKIKIQPNQDTIKLAKDMEPDFHNFNYDSFCQTDIKNSEMKNINAEELHEMMVSNEGLLIIDVREPYEGPKILEKESINIPFAQLARELKNHANKEVVLYCRSGMRSMIAGYQLKNMFPEITFYNLDGGVIDYVHSPVYKSNV
jgi:sulfur-carrier protein adenylyltransferase/sulfurtransferase